MAKRILIIATDGFEQSELIEPKKALEAAGFETAGFETAGFETVVASIKPGVIKGWNHGNWGESVPVDTTLDEVEADQFDALLIPGGQMNPDVMRMQAKAIDLVEDFDDQGKPIAAICHGPWLLVEADIVDGRTVTSWPSVRTDLSNAGADVVDEEVAIDGNLITSRMPSDIPAFSKALIEMLQDAEVDA